MNNRKMLSVANGPGMSGNLSGASRPDNLSRRFPDATGGELWSPCSSSSDENNSPTALNSFDWDKPALEDKAVNFGFSQNKKSGGVSEVNALNISSRKDVSENKGKSGYANVGTSERKYDIKHAKILACGDIQKRSRTCSTGLSDLCSDRLPQPLNSTESDDLQQDSCIEGSEEDFLKEKEELRNVAWFQAGIPREIALEVLQGQEEGSFIVRESSTRPGCFALSLRVPPEKNPSGIAHYLILRTQQGYKIKGFTKEFHSLTALITHHSVMPEMLPCPLSLHRPSTRDAEHEFDDPPPETPPDIFEDIHWLMTDLNL
ncbi:EGFR adapter protein-like [Uloborus diversus]|uniref:EGFR adapter protein-like n=1 Tax=Uloborus diversus TaxID=327109 RepID=UPI00240A66CF|nr:EGFR adapter protein-like [Uloborus diversus]